MRFIKIIFLGFFIGVPLIVVPQFFSNFELAKVILFRAFTIIFAFYIIVKILFQKTINLPSLQNNKIFYISFLLLISSLIIAAFFSSSPLISFFGDYFRQQGLLSYIFYFIFLFSVILFFADKKNLPTLNQIIKYLVYGAVTISIIAIFQKIFPDIAYLRWQEDEFIGRVFGTMGHPNFLAAYLVMASPFCFLKNLKWKWIFLGIILTAIFLTGSRAALLAEITIILFLFIRSKKTFYFGIITILLSVFATMILNISGSTFERLTDSNSVEGRVMIWKASIEAIIDKPFFGYGPEMASEGISKFIDNDILKFEKFTNIADRAHNAILDWALNTGLIGLSSYVFFIFTIIYSAIKKRKDEIIFLSLVAFAGLFINNLFSFSTTVHSMIFWFLCGVIFAKSLEFKNIKNDFKKWAKILIIIIISIASLFSFNYFSLRPALADYYFQKAIFEEFNLKFFTATNYLRKTYLLNPHEIYYQKMSVEYLLATLELKNLSDGMRTTLGKRLDYFAKKIEQIKKRNFESNIVLGRYYGKKENFKKSQKYFEKIENEIKSYPPLYLYWAESLAGQNKTDLAYEKYQKYFQMVPELDDENYNDDFRRFLKNNPTFLSTLDEMITICEKLSLKDELKYYQNIKEKILQLYTK